MMKIIVISLLVLFCINLVLAQNVENLEPNSTEFFRLITNSNSLFESLLWKEGTLFLPENSLLTNTTTISNSTLLYYYSVVVYTSKDLEELNSILSQAPGNPPLWIRKCGSNLYVNDAKILTSSVIEFGGKIQTLYLIDRLLSPTLPSSGFLANPNALEFTEHSLYYNVPSQYRSLIFVRAIQMNDTDKLFKTPGHRTFFIPIDNEELILRRLDSRVVSAHVIQDSAIFLRSGENYEEECTTVPLENKDTHGMHVSFQQLNIKKTQIWYVHSINEIGDSSHREGVVEARILKPNIPVSNGVIHLISRPIFTTKKNVLQSLKWYNETGLYSVGKFVELLFEYGGDEIQDLLTNSSEITLFVPEDEAVEKVRLSLINKNPTEIKKLLRTHILLDIISSEKMREYSKLEDSPFLIQSGFKGIELMFSSCAVNNMSSKVFVEGRGVNATITQTNLLSTNGYIHIVNKFLGIPEESIQQKLATHPLLTYTYHVYMECKPNFKESGIEFSTIFAPSNFAWKKLYERSKFYRDIETIHGSYKNEMMQKLLLSHILKNEVLIEDIRNTISNTSEGKQGMELGNGKSISEVILPGPRPEDTHKSYYYVIGQLKGKIIRPDIIATNGVIHIIDDILVEDGDDVPGALTAATTNLVPMSWIILTIHSMYTLYKCT